MAQPRLIPEPTKWAGPRSSGDGRRRRVEANEHGQQRQHFLLRSEAVDIGEFDVAQLTEDEAFELFEAMRFAKHGGIPTCPHGDCGASHAYRLTINRPIKKDGVVVGSAPTRIYKCRTCRRQFSATSGKEWAYHKMSFKKIVYAHLVFANAVSGEAALRMRRALRASYKAAFVLEGKFRDAIRASRSKRLLEGVIEVDGKSIGGHQRKGSKKKNGRETYTGKPSREQAILALRERRPDGESRVFILDHETHYRDPVAKTDLIRDSVVHGSTMVSDEGFSLAYIGPHQTVKHKAGYINEDGWVHTNGVEGLFARVWRAEMGVYYKWAGSPYLDLYAHEVSWREDYRRRSTGELLRMLLKATANTDSSPTWRGYWQRWRRPDAPRRNRPIPCAPRPLAA